jgi:hypothetical protein
MIIGSLSKNYHSYQNIFIVQNRNYWKACHFEYNREKDLVLTLDYGLIQEIDAAGGTVGYLDHITDNQIMERYNYEMYYFFSRWYCDKNGDDLFSHRKIGVGNAFRVEIWNDLTYFTRMFINLSQIVKSKYDNIFVGIDDEVILKILSKLGLKYSKWLPPKEDIYKSYYFPIFQWNSEQIYPSRFRSLVKRLIIFTGNVLIDILKLIKLRPDNVDIYIHDYHPTRPVIDALIKDGKVNIINETLRSIKRLLIHQRLPGWTTSNKNRQFSKTQLANFKNNKHEKWIIEGIEISEMLYELFLNRISDSLPFYLQYVDTLIRFFKKKNLKLAIPISNIGNTNCLILNYCEANNISSYLIINGLLTASYLDEAKNATWINSYGESIKNDYFESKSNIVCLGDPRMDVYANSSRVRCKKKRPVILIGAAGYDNIDLNSYLAYEFDFLKDVLSACEILIQQGFEMELVIKVRPNGYLKQYADFVKEYFPGLPIELHDSIPFREIAEQSDFYISFYSQTILEVSSLGIPAIYYKKDNQFSHPPFDGKSELITALSIKDLIDKIGLYYSGSKAYDLFMKKEVLEKYIGPLDGKNLNRNMEFIYALLEREK